MPQVEATVTVQAPVEKLWELAQQVEKMPEYMPDLESVEILEEQERSATQRYTKTRWVGIIKQMGRKIHWTEEDIWDSSNYQCTFAQTEGEFTEYSGLWRFEKIDSQQTKAHLELNYAIEIPLLGALIQKVIKRLMQDNCDNMLSSLKAEAEK